MVLSVPSVQKYVQEYVQMSPVQGFSRTASLYRRDGNNMLKCADLVEQGVYLCWSVMLVFVNCVMYPGALVAGSVPRAMILVVSHCIH